VLAVMGPERMFGEMSVLSRDAKTSCEPTFFFFKQKKK
jgi:hypothetical protein